MNILVTRHDALTELFYSLNIDIDKRINHMSDSDVSDLNPGDVAFGILPMRLATAVCESGARFVECTMDIPANLRGIELNFEQIMICKPRLIEYKVRAVAEMDYTKQQRTKS